MQVQEAVKIAAPWASLYNNHPLVQSVVLFGHLSGIMVGGGAAVAADRAAIRARRVDGEERHVHLARLQRVHRTVLGALAVVLISGILLFAADIETFVNSPMFWVKMGLVLLLVVNGWLLTRTGRRLDDGRVGWERGWKRLAVTSGLSLSFWFLVILAGTVLVSLG